MLGTYALSAGYFDAFYGKATLVRGLIRQDFDRAFEQVDVIVSATSPSVAFKIGQKTDNPLEMYLADVMTISANLAGVCGMSVPCGFGEGGMPIGLQLMGKPFNEETILCVAHAYEQSTTWHLQHPALAMA